MAVIPRNSNVPPVLTQVDSHVQFIWHNDVVDVVGICVTPGNLRPDEQFGEALGQVAEVLVGLNEERLNTLERLTPPSDLPIVVSTHRTWSYIDPNASTFVMMDVVSRRGLFPRARNAPVAALPEPPPNPERSSPWAVRLCISLVGLSLIMILIFANLFLGR